MPPDKYGDALKLVQIAFYAIASVVAILTYRAARRGLLNTVNTEYQKRVMDRLQKLSDDLYSEFEKYAQNLAKGKQEPITDLDGINKIHNKLVDQMNAQGCGIGQIEQEVHGIRRLIQQYFDSFNPHRRWWNRR